MLIFRLKKREMWVMFFNPKFMDNILSHFYSPCYRANWAIFDINNTSVGVKKIYALNDYRERALLWEWLSNNLPNSNWIFMGDFNMIENIQDKRWGLYITRKEMNFTFGQRLRENLN